MTYLVTVVGRREDGYERIIVHNLKAYQITTKVDLLSQCRCGFEQVDMLQAASCISDAPSSLTCNITRRSLSLNGEGQHASITTAMADLSTKVSSTPHATAQ
jgi:hypothetical protein